MQGDDERPGWGILGPGGIAGAFVRDLRVAERRVVAVGGRDLGRARAFADAHGIPTAHGSAAELAADPDVDVVYIATPHPFHADSALTMLRAGKHVLVEKPFTLNEPQAREVFEVAAASGLVVLEAMWTRWLPHMLEIHAAIDRGEIGRPQVLIADHTQSITADPHHRLNAPELGGGALLDLGVYPVSFAVDLFGEPERILAAATFTPTGVDQRVSATLVHDGGAHTIMTSASDLPGPNRAAILGDAGTIEIEGVWYTPTAFVVKAADGSEVRRSRPEVPGRGMQFQAYELERLILEGAPESPRMPIAESLAVMRTMDGIRAEIGLVYPQESAGER